MNTCSKNVPPLKKRLSWTCKLFEMASLSAKRYTMKIHPDANYLFYYLLSYYNTKYS